MNGCGIAAGILLLSIVVCLLIYPALVISGRISREEEAREWKRKQ